MSPLKNGDLRQLDLTSATAVVTGGASGIGRGLAEAMILRGVNVIIADLDENTGRETAKEIGASFIRCDVTSADDVDALLKAASDQFGRVNILCNNAGVGPAGTIEQTTLADFKWMLEINLWGVIHGIRSFLPALKRAGIGHILNTASLSGLVGTPTRGAYAASKFAVVALTEVLAKELAAESSGVGASVLCPGPVRTNIGSGSKNRKDLAQAGVRDFNLEQLQVFKDRAIRWLDPIEAGNLALEGILRGDLYIQTHPELSGPVFDRHRMIEQSFDRVEVPA